MEGLRYIQPVPLHKHDCFCLFLQRLLYVSGLGWFHMAHQEHKYLTMDFGHFGYMDTRTISIIIIKRNSTKCSDLQY